MLYHFKIANTCKCLLVPPWFFLFWGSVFAERKKRMTISQLVKIGIICLAFVVIIV